MASNYGVPSRGKGARGQTVIQGSRADPARSGATLLQPEESWGRVSEDVFSGVENYAVATGSF